MTRELITLASYLNTNFNQVIYTLFNRSKGMLFYVSRLHFIREMERVKSYKNQQDGRKGRDDKKKSRELIFVDQVYGWAGLRIWTLAIAVNFMKIH